MPLALIVDSLDSVPEALRAAYVADGDKFKLDADVPDVSRFEAKARKAETESIERRKQLKAWEGLGKTPDEIQELLAAQDAAAAEAAKKAGNFDTILKQHQDKWGVREKELETELNAARASERGAIIETSVMGALTKAKATAEGVDLLTERLGKRIKFETVDGKRKIQIMQADGETPLAGTGAEGAATFDDLVKEAVKNWPSLFEGAGGGGGGTPPKGGKPGEKTITRADFAKLGPVEAAAMSKTHKIVD